MLETLIFQCSIAIAHKYDNFMNISKRLWNLVYIWSLLLSLKFQANTYSFERVVTLFVGYYFSSGHSVHVHTWFEDATPRIRHSHRSPLPGSDVVLLQYILATPMLLC